MKSAGGILVVDDDADLRECLQLMLTSMGFEVTSAANGQEALDDMEGHDPDLILLDMKMPVMNGWEFCRALEGRDSRPPIVVLTAAPDPGPSSLPNRAWRYLPVTLGSAPPSPAGLPRRGTGASYESQKRNR